MSEKDFVNQFKEFIEDFEKEIEIKLKDKGISKFVWIHDSDLDIDDITLRGNCASQAGCGSNRCKDKIDLCTVRYCRRLHNCGSNCQVGTDCKVDYCHGRCVSGRT